MTEPSVAAVAAILVGIGLLLFAGWRRRRRDQHALVSELERKLEAEMAPGTGSHLERAPTVRRLAVVERAEGDRGDAVVPVVRVDLGTSDAPGMEMVFEYVAAVLEAIHPVLAERDERVAHYDVEFTFGPGGLLVSGECRRVSVPPALADRLFAEENYRAFDLRRDVERGEDGSATWAECTKH
ncbi:hypothetical protein AB7C87_06035 [Natrarchaeobius sp. A-rgal3]|uniref:hypothetical protein n=1 Tax=Natrarchaeobius versutus TaxID=1679078 RepID=UPI00350F6F81